MAKLFCSEASWNIIDGLMQLRGGRGYETASSLRERGEKGYAVERMMRDARVNRIIEGTSEILRLFIAREALDKHVRLAGDLFSPKVSIVQKLKALGVCAAFYPFWYLRLWLPTGFWPRFAGYGSLAKHIRFIERNSRKLARTLFHQMIRFGPKLERRQMILARLVDVGTELFAMAASCAKAMALEKENSAGKGPQELADLFCCQARIRIYNHFMGVCWNTDVKDSRVALKAMEGGYEWLEKGIIVDGGEGFKGKK